MKTARFSKKTSRKLNDILEEINRLSNHQKEISSELREELDQFCKKRYLFDIILYFFGKSHHSRMVEVISESFLQIDKKSGILFLFALLHPGEEIFDEYEFYGLAFDDYNFHFYIIIAKYVMNLNLSSNDFKSVCEYFLRRVVANLLISDVRSGTGFTTEKWKTDRFYETLLTKKPVFEMDKSFHPLDLAEKIISVIAQEFQKHNLKKLILTYEYSYSVMEKEFLRAFDAPQGYHNSKKNFISWQRSQNILPEFFELMKLQLLIPNEGLLLPNKKLLFSEEFEKDLIIRSNFGIFDLTAPIHALKSLLAEDYLSEVEDYLNRRLVNKFYKAYMAWHEELGVTEDLNSALKNMST